MIFDFEKVAGGFREVGGQNRRRLMRKLVQIQAMFATRLVMYPLEPLKEVLSWG